MDGIWNSGNDGRLAMGSRLSKGQGTGFSNDIRGKGANHACTPRDEIPLADQVGILGKCYRGRRSKNGLLR